MTGPGRKCGETQEKRERDKEERMWKSESGARKREWKEKER